MRWLLLTLLLLPTTALAEWWGVATLTSHHKERDRGYNERNLGLGAEYHLDKRWHLAGGFYKNSYYRTTVYGALGYELFSWRALHVGGAVVGLTGYTEGQVDWVLAPIVSFEFKHWGLNLAPLTPEVVGLQVKVRLP